MKTVWRLSTAQELILNVVSSVAAIAVVMAGFYVLWINSWHGLDITDEGFSLFVAAFPRDVQAAVSQAHFFAHPIWIATGQNISIFWIFGYILMAGSAAFLCYQYLSQNRVELIGYRVLFCGATIVLSWAYYIWTIRTPNYNWFVSNLLLMTIGCWLSLRDGRASKSFKTYSILAGALILMLVVVKPPAGLIVLFVFAVLIYLKILACWFRGFALGAVGPLLVISFQASPSEVFASFGRGLQQRTESSHTTFGLVSTLFSALSEFALSIGWPVLVAAGIAIAFKVLKRQFSWEVQTVVAIINFAMIAWFCLNGGLEGQASGDYSLRISALLVQLVLVSVFFLATTRSRSLTPKDVIFWSIVFVMPWVGAFGSARPLTYNFVFYLPIWALIFFHTIRRISLSLAVSTITICAIIVIAALNHAYKFSPHRMPLRNEATSSFKSQFGEIMVSPELNEALLAIQKEMSFTSAARPPELIGLCSIPGLVYLAGARSPVAPWWISGYNNSKKLITKNLSTYLSKSKSAEFWVLVDQASPECV